MKKNTTALVAKVLGVKRSLVQAIWRRVKECRALGIPIDVSSRKPKNCGRKKIK
jgi:biotin operon repressor